MTTLKIETVTGIKFEVTGTNYTHKNGIHYLDAASYPDKIIKEVKHD